MGVAVAIGDLLPNAAFYLKYNSVNNFSIFFWDDVASTIPSSLAGATVTIETGSVDTPTTFMTGSVVGTTNEVQFSVSAANSTTLPDGTAFRVVMSSGGSSRFVIASGKVRVQK